MSNTTDEFRNLSARDVMQTDMLTIPRSAGLSQLEALLGEHRIGGVPVTDESGHIVGIVSMRDLLERYSQDPDSRPRRGHGFYRLSSEELQDDIESFDVPEESEDTVADIMTSDVRSVPPDAKLPAVSALLIEQGIHRVLVRDNGKYIGLITTFDLLRAVTP